MLAFKDFVPRQLKAPHFGLSVEAFQGEYETLAAALAAANAWLTETRTPVLHVETVVLPGLWESYEEGSQDPVLGAGGRGPLWHQFIRVWYQVEQ